MEEYNTMRGWRRRIVLSQTVDRERGGGGHNASLGVLNVYLRNRNDENLKGTRPRSHDDDHPSQIRSSSKKSPQWIYIIGYIGLMWDLIKVLCLFKRYFEKVNFLPKKHGNKKRESLTQRKVTSRPWETFVFNKELLRSVVYSRPVSMGLVRALTQRSIDLCDSHDWSHRVLLNTRIMINYKGKA